MCISALGCYINWTMIISRVILPLTIACKPSNGEEKTAEEGTPRANRFMAPLRLNEALGWRKCSILCVVTDILHIKLTYTNLICQQCEGL